jgi:hypothetical protein
LISIIAVQVEMIKPDRIPTKKINRQSAAERTPASGRAGWYSFKVAKG